MAYPGSTERVVQDLIPDVIDALQGRSDVSTTMAARYIRRAVQEVTASEAFEELRATGPTAQLTTNQPVYQLNFFLNPNDDITFIEAIVIFVDFPNNTTTNVLKFRNPQAIEMMIAPTTTGIPGWWTRFGKNIHFGPVPNNPFSVYVRYQIRHPFPKDVNAIAGAPLYIPEDWEEIIVYEAAHRIAIVKRWNDQADYIHKTLFGDPESMLPDGKLARPGLYMARKMQVERDEQFSTRQLSIMVPHYSRR